LELSTLENSTLTFALTPILVVTFKCVQLFIQDHKVIQYGFKIILEYVGFC